MINHRQHNYNSTTENIITERLTTDNTIITEHLKD